MALFPVRTNPRWRPPPSWIISNGHISQQLTIYLYSAQRAVIFAIAQLSCLIRYLFIVSCRDKLWQVFACPLSISNILIVRPHAVHNAIGVANCTSLSVCQSVTAKYNIKVQNGYECGRNSYPVCILSQPVLSFGLLDADIYVRFVPQNAIIYVPCEQQLRSYQLDLNITT